jgi:hypothetical protein
VQHPAECDLTSRCALPRGRHLYDIDRFHIGIEIRTLKAWIAPPVIPLWIRFCTYDVAGQKTLPSGTKATKSAKGAAEMSTLDRIILILRQSGYN